MRHVVLVAFEPWYYNISARRLNHYTTLPRYPYVYQFNLKGISRIFFQVSTFFIIVLALVDLTTCLLLIPGTIYMEYFDFYTFNDFVCKSYLMFNSSMIHFSALIMVAIALERYFCICHPFLRLLSLFRAKILLALLATAATTIGIFIALTHRVSFQDDVIVAGAITSTNNYRSDGGDGKFHFRSPSDKFNLSTLNEGDDGDDDEDDDGGHGRGYSNSYLMFNKDYNYNRNININQNNNNNNDVNNNFNSVYNYIGKHNNIVVSKLTNSTTSNNSNTNNNNSNTNNNNTNNNNTNNNNNNTNNNNTSSEVSGDNGDKIYIGKCKQDFSLMSLQFQDHFGRLVNSFFIIYLALVIILYSIIYKSVMTSNNNNNNKNNTDNNNHCILSSSPSHANSKDTVVYDSKKDTDDIDTTFFLACSSAETTSYIVNINANNNNNNNNDIIKTSHNNNSTDINNINNKNHNNKNTNNSTTTTTTTTANFNNIGNVDPNQRQQHQQQQKNLKKLTNNIVFRIRLNRHNNNNNINSNSNKSVRKKQTIDGTMLANMKTAAMLFVVTLVFFLTFTPALLHTTNIIEVDNQVLFYLYFANNVANPIIYSFMNGNFRVDLKNLLCRSSRGN
ncbi:hypothetical protein HELRODRAFT_189138 [Helobdella robusta]|uniref:G-protein coupled receptors family 1 profile domain-containing protein n=1 Tax=Helobdella robusta TaxID=6412 RepID=T1FQQ0_HELRO|nr:hypothetical protein HELRODRAFT_189138 [Helobdella robusta]ESN96171.1 hypothetical protein HELRODRAFT_189138 [Helobdella robusta]